MSEFFYVTLARNLCLVAIDGFRMPASLPPTQGPAAALMRALMADQLTQAEAAAAMGAFFAECRSLSLVARQSEVDALIPIVDQAPTGPACFLSVALGGLIEQGASPGAFTATLHRMLSDLLPRVVHLARETETRRVMLTQGTDRDLAEESHPEEGPFAQALTAASAEYPLSREAWDQLGVLWPACVAVYCSVPAARQKAREFLPLFQKLREEHEGGYWLCQLLNVLDDEPFVVIDPARRVGITGRMTGCVDNFQLHSLLLEAFPRRWYQRRRITPTALSVMTGSGPQEHPETIVSHWNLYEHTALDASGRVSAAAQIQTSHWIWGEGSPNEIGTVEGVRVVILGPASYLRSWNCARRFARMTAGLGNVRPLSKTEVADWLRRCQSTAASGEHPE